MKLTNNTEKLLVILILMLGLVVAMISVGILTRDFSSEKSTDPIAELPDQSIRQVVMQVELDRVKILEEKIHKVREEYILEKEHADTISALSAETVYVNYAYEIAKSYYPDIDPEYVCAIIYHESRFDPTATNSKTGVRGLTQINPKWHTKRAESLGVMDLYEPYGNILVCFDILNELTQKYGFDYALNFYAGGYKYANGYRNSKSPFIKQLQEIMADHNFSGQVLPYSITENGGVLNGES